MYGMFWGLLSGSSSSSRSSAWPSARGIGALMGKIEQSGVDEEFQRQVQDLLQPGTSALFLVVENVTPGRGRRRAEPLRRHRPQTSLSQEAEAELQAELGGMPTTSWSRRARSAWRGDAIVDADAARRTACCTATSPGRRASHSYGYVLLLIGATFFFTATAPDDAWATSTLVLLQTVTLCVALWTSGLARAGSLLNVACLVRSRCWSAVTGLFWAGSTVAGLLALLAGVLTIAIVLVLALSIVDQGEINAQSITGAICIYILLGMIFLFIYGAAAAFGHGAFFAQGTDGTRALRLYFSYVTLATLGYGDYTPAGNFGHALAVIEALLGQLYLVTVVAVLVSRCGRGARRRVDG